MVVTAIFVMNLLPYQGIIILNLKKPDFTKIQDIQYVITTGEIKILTVFL
jgi:hypothetical protein